MAPKLAYIQTIGCQMNVYDSDRMMDHLVSIGFSSTESVENADLIIVNTCTIRQKAEQKAFSFLGRLAMLKKKKPDLIIGIGGCVAQQEGKKILSRMPHVDLVFGTGAIDRLPKMIERIVSGKSRIVDVELLGHMEEKVPANKRRADGDDVAKVSEFVTIMRGCDNFCTYCVVPHVRGREHSRPAEVIVREIEALVDNGVREVTLLGQNVNSYGKKEDWQSFAQLLKQVNDIQGLERIRFTTSHPKDLSDELMRSFAELDKLCHHIHLPVQSGANAILKRMNRKYTRESYLEKVEKLRNIRPDIALTTDIIVGFPGESEADFQLTMDLIREVEFDGLFSFIYSDRPNAPAADFTDKLPEEMKKRRLQQVLALQEQFTLKKHRAMVGTVQCVLVEGESKKQGALNPEQGPAFGSRQDSGIQWMGRTPTNKIVNFSAKNEDTQESRIHCGQLVNILIEEALPHSLWGQLASSQNSTCKQKGAQSYAA